jgi:hypothetical protein
MQSTTRNRSSSNSPPIDADLLRSVLDAQDHRQLLSKCGFSLDGHRGTELQGVHGPKALGEGENGNFSVDLDKGVVKDWGSTGYEGHVFNVVQDVEGLSFTEALNWIVEELRLDADELTVSGDGHSSGKPPTPPSRPEPSTSDSDNGEDERSPQNGSDDPESVVGHEQVTQWHERLEADTEAARAARTYLTKDRGIDHKALVTTKVGLAHTPDDYRATWWIMIPIPHHEEPSCIAAVKGFGFDPGSRGWARDDDGRKVARNGGSAALYDLSGIVAEGSMNGPPVLCEGEIDALSAVSNGFPAITKTSGARSDFKPEWADHVAALDVVQEYGVAVAYDGDDAGREGAQDDAQRLSEAGAEVKVATLPDGADVNDVLLDGGAADLNAHVVQADTFEPETTEDIANEMHPSGDGHAGSPPANFEQWQQERGGEDDVSLDDLRIESAPDLLSEDIRPPEPLVTYDGRSLLHEGTSQLAAKPKIGKTNLAMNLGIAVASDDGQALGGAEVQRHGRVLMLNLDGSRRGTHGRLDTMTAHGESPPPERFDVLHGQFPNVGEGALNLLYEYVEVNPDTELVIVDTLQHLRPPSSGRRNQYHSDYDFVHPISQFGRDTDTSVLLVHHLNKIQNGDELDKVSGSTGMTGAVENVMMLDRARGETKATLSVRPREGPDEDFDLDFSGHVLTWCVVEECITGDSYEPESEARREIWNYLCDALTTDGDNQRRLKEIAEGVGKSTDNVSKRLADMKQNGAPIKKPSRGVYEVINGAS